MSGCSLRAIWPRLSLMSSANELSCVRCWRPSPIWSGSRIWKVFILPATHALAGYTAADGVEAVERVAAERYALILMDMQMPRLDGLGATMAIRAQPAGAQVPILTMPANAFADDRARCLAAGMNDYITKPVEPAVLCRALRYWLRQQAANPSAG